MIRGNISNTPVASIIIDALAFFDSNNLQNKINKAVLSTFFDLQANFNITMYVSNINDLELIDNNNILYKDYIVMDIDNFIEFLIRKNTYVFTTNDRLEIFKGQAQSNLKNIFNIKKIIKNQQTW